MEDPPGRTPYGRALIWSSLVWACLAPWAQSGSLAEGAEWQTVKSKHFVVLHTCGEIVAREIADRAETLYEVVAADLGYTRYRDFWLWDRRVKILIYPTAKDFALACDAPAWAGGRASYVRHEIASYLAERGRLPEDIIPHELAHLILNDFVGTERVPLWLAEGFAQWEQSGRKHASGPQDAEAGCRMPFATWASLDIRREQDPQRVRRYYDQSASVVGFLIQEYGGERFGRFCRALRDGKMIDKALESVYPDNLSNLARLEVAWLKHREGEKR